MSKVQEYLNKKKQTPPKSEIQVAEKQSPYMELLYRDIEKAIMGKMKTLRGEDGHTPTEEEINKLLDSIIEKKRDKLPKKEELLKYISSLIPKVKDGKTPEKGTDYFTKSEAEEFLKQATPIKGKHYFDGAPGRPGRSGENVKLPSTKELAISAINLLETFEGDDRLDAKAIKNLRKIIKEIVSQETVGYNAGGPGIIFHDTTLGGSGQPGDPLKVIDSGVAATWNEEYGSGLVNSVNRVFTFSHKVAFISLEGSAYSALNGDYTVDV